MPCPLGEAKASWSNVITWPPAFRILRRAPLVTLRAQIYGKTKEHKDYVTNWLYTPETKLCFILLGKNKNRQFLTFSLGMSWILTSSVTVPTTTAVLFSRPGIFILRIWLQRKQHQQFNIHNQIWATQSRLNWQGSCTFNSLPGIKVLKSTEINGEKFCKQVLD